MSRGCIQFLAVLAAIAVAVGYLVYRAHAGAVGSPIHIAVVGPMTGANENNGRSFVEGARLCVENVNRGGGIDGHRVVLDIYDDRNNPKLAAETARQIVADDRAVAVIGHNYSSCSLRGGEVYKEAGIPAVSPSSTAPSVTLGNKWYFRTIFSDSLEGAFIPNYIARVLDSREVAVISETGPYGSQLSDIFAEAGAPLGVEIKHHWTFDPDSMDLGRDLDLVAGQLEYSGFSGIVFLAVHAEEGVKLVRTIRDMGLENTLVAPNALASGSFSSGFDVYSEEQRNPGYYTNGIFVSSPLLLDSADEDGQEFRNEYQQRYDGRDPDWRAAFSFDAALVLVEGLKSINGGWKSDNLSRDRSRLRDWMARLRSIDVAVKGVTGFNYFDRNGDSQKPVYLGMYHDRNIISTLTQFEEVPSLHSVPDLENEIREGRIVLVNGRYMYSTDVVYVGIKMNSISEVNIRKRTCQLDFDLWFRSQGDNDASNIVFLNAAEEVELGAPVDKTRFDGLSYVRYRVEGLFKLDYLPAKSFEKHAIAVSFVHRRLTRNNLVYVIDVVGMDLPNSRAFTDHLEENQVLNSASGWRIANARLFQDVVEVGSQGNPRFIERATAGLKFSRFSSKITIERERLALRRHLSTDVSVTMAAIGLLIIFAIILSARTDVVGRFSRLFALLNFLAGIAALLGAEVAIVDGMIDTLARYQLEQITQVFDILWWIVPAVYLVHGLEHFLWRPLERSADQKIPNIVRRFVSFVIYTLAFFGIIAFVYDQKITSLLATSGVIAMIIGLAIQINISNIFSGIALNLERPFKVGDWIRVADFDEAKVLDMTWRTTRLQLRDNTVLCVPNSIAAESRMVNYHRPDETYEVWITFHVDPEHDPRRVIKIALDALQSHPDVVADPAPGCRFIGFTEWSAEFVAVPVFSGYGKRNIFRGSVMTHLWKELHRAGIRQAIRVQELHMLRGVKPGLARSASPVDILLNVEIFRPLSDEAKEYLAGQMERLEFASDDLIVEQGDEGDSLFIIVEGTVGVVIALADGDTIEVDRMGAGTFFGEMALLTGEARTATIRAITATVVFKITKDHMAPLLAKQPEMTQILSEELTRRTINRETKKNAHEASNIDEEALFSKFLGKIQSFFGL